MSISLLGFARELLGRVELADVGWLSGLCDEYRRMAAGHSPSGCDAPRDGVHRLSKGRWLGN